MYELHKVHKQKGNAVFILIVKSEVRRSLGIHKLRCEKNIKVDHKK
jgi:hypothetical protein